MELLDMFKISATSKDGHGYTVELAAHPDKITESFNAHMSNIGWEHYQYTITNYKAVKSNHIVVGLDDNIN